MFKRALLAVALTIGAGLIYAAPRPDTYHVERSATIAAPPEVVFAKLDDLQAFVAWSPWGALDASMKKTFGGPEKGVGATYEWQGNERVGRGKVKITESAPPSRVVYELEFIEPFHALATTTFTIAPVGDRSTTVTWAMDGHNDFVGKVFGIFMNVDDKLGADFERGLASLKAAVEDAPARAQPTTAAPADAGR